MPFYWRVDTTTPFIVPCLHFHLQCFHFDSQRNCEYVFKLNPFFIFSFTAANSSYFPFFLRLFFYFAFMPYHQLTPLFLYCQIKRKFKFVTAFSFDLFKRRNNATPFFLFFPTNMDGGNSCLLLWNFFFNKSFAASCRAIQLKYVLSYISFTSVCHVMCCCLKAVTYKSRHTFFKCYLCSVLQRHKFIACDSLAQINLVISLTSIGYEGEEMRQQIQLNVRNSIT